jgi:autotransporter-associated beta strand protein
LPAALIGMAAGIDGVIVDFNGSQAAGSAFTTAANWDNGVVPLNDLFSNIARFNKTSYANIFSDANYSLNGLIFGDGVTPAAPIDITIVGAAGQQLMLGYNGIVMHTNAGAATVNKIQLGANQVWANYSTNMLSVGTLGNLSSNAPHAVTLAGAGPITINDISDNTNAGTTAVMISGSTLTLGGDNSFTGGLTLNSGTIKYYGTGTPLGRGLFTIGNGVTISHANTSATIITNQMLVTGNFTMSGQTNTQWGGAMNLNSGTRTITVSSDSVVASIISNGRLIKAGTKTLTLSGANTYGGGTIVSNGALVASSDGALGAGHVTVANGATLILQTNAAINDQAVLVAGTNSTLTIDFIGSEEVGALSLNGGTTWLTNGTYDAAALDALGTGTYGGSGSLAVAGVADDPANTPYGWLAQYGLTNFNVDATADADHDGLLTWQEYVAGTNPTNSASVFKIIGSSVNAQGAVIRWASASNKLYNLSRTTNLLESFAAVAGATNLPATPPENIFTNSQNDGAAAFYRIGVHQ